MHKKEIPLLPTMFFDPEPKKHVKTNHTSRTQTVGMLNLKWLEWSARQIKPTECSCDKGGDYCWDGPKEKVCDDLKHYERNRLRWKGFQQDMPNAYCNSAIWVIFKSDGKVVVQSDSQNIYVGSSSVALFEMICKENGIELSGYE